MRAHLSQTLPLVQRLCFTSDLVLKGTYWGWPTSSLRVDDAFCATGGAFPVLQLSEQRAESGNRAQSMPAAGGAAYRTLTHFERAAGIIGFALVDFVGCPAPLAVLVGGVCGVVGWAAHMH